MIHKGCCVVKPKHKHYCSKNINVLENTITSAVNEFVINELVKLIVL